METDLNLLPQLSGNVLLAIDAHSANSKNRTGVQNYAFHLIQAMKNHSLREEERVVLYSYEPLREPLSILPNGWSSKVLAWPLRKGWMSIRVPSELRKDRPNVFFVPAQAIPNTKIPVLTTIHDVGFQVVPEVYDPTIARKLHAKTKKAVQRAKLILSVSEATKNDLIRLYNADPERISVTSLSADTDIYHKLEEERIQAVQEKFRIGKRFFLTVGRVEKKKNISTLIRAFDLFKSRRGSGDPYELILVGEPGYGYAEIKSYIEASPFKNQIRELGYVSDEDVSALMNASTAYLFPSWFEGFGIPNLEAMASGTPLITSDIPAHREVVQDAGIFVSPNEPEAWAKEMADLINDDSKRLALIERGNKRVQEFSWNQTAQKTWDVLYSLI